MERIGAQPGLVERIRTGNAGSNAPMLRINRELGFKPYKSITVWQVGVDRVLEYLATSEFKHASGMPYPVPDTQHHHAGSQ